MGENVLCPVTDHGKKTGQEAQTFCQRLSHYVTTSTRSHHYSVFTSNGKVTTTHAIGGGELQQQIRY